MGQIDTFRDVIKLWTTLDGMALDIGAKPSAISKWRKRDSIPAEWWVAILSTEPAAHVGLTAETLASLAAREAAEARA
jgi:hypothetical protein